MPAATVYAMFRFLRRFGAALDSIPDEQWQSVSVLLPPLAQLAQTERSRLRELVRLFLAEKRIAGSAGFALSPAQRLEIATWACLPVLHIGIAAYRGFRGIIVYPDEFLAPREECDEIGVVHEGYEQVAGESWDQGPILLSWADVEQARRSDGYNVVIHECAHKLDMADGEMNGVPDLSGSGISGAEWQRVMEAAWRQMHAEEQRCGAIVIDDYALESPAEFFAVLSEQFFTDRERLAAALPQACALLERFYLRGCAREISPSRSRRSGN